MGGKKRRHRRRPCPPEKMASDTIQLIRRYLAYLLAYRTAFGGMILCMVLSALLEPLLPLLLKPLLDGNAEGATPFLRENLPYIMLLLVFLLAVLLYGRVYLGGWLDATLQKNLHTLMCERLLILPMARLGDESMGALTTRIMSFVPALTASTMPVFLALVQEPLKTVVYIGVMFYLQWQLAIIILLATPFVALIIFFLGRRMKKIAGKNQQLTMRCQTTLNEAVHLMPIIKIQGGDTAKAKLSGVFSALRGVMLRVHVAIAAGQPLSQIVVAIPSAIVIGYAISALEAGAMTSGDVAAFLGVMLLMPRSVRAITRSMVVFSQMQVAAREVFGFLDTPPEADNGEGLINRCRGEVSFNGITMRYATTKKAALTDVFLTIAPGETVALVGKSGAGKTTLANLLPRFYEPTSGIVRLDGEDVRSFKLADLRRQIALVTQEPLLTDDTIAANVAYPDNGNADADKVNQALQNAAADFVAELPDGVNTPSSEKTAVAYRAGNISDWLWRALFTVMRQSLFWMRRPHLWTLMRK